MLPKYLLSIKGRSCNQTPLVHQDMTKKNTFYENLYVKCKIGLWFLSSALPLINIYVCDFNPFCSFKDMAQTGIHYEKKWLWGDNYVNIQCRIIIYVHCPSPDCHLSINQDPFQSPLYFSRYGPDRQHL